MEKFLDFIIITFLSFLFSLNICYETNITIFIMCFIISEIIFYLIWDKIFKIKLENKKSVILKREFIIYGILIALILIFALISYYPAYATVDSIDQYKQAITNTYSNWHPVMHTLFLYKLPQLFSKNILFSTIFQISIIFMILMYFCYWLRKNYFDFKYTLFILSIIIFNPLFIKYSVTLWKDVLFSWCIFIGTLFLINIIKSDGDWLRKNKNKFIFILVSLGILYFRHNGIVPFSLMFILLIIFISKYKKFFIMSFISIILSMVLITNPVYKLLKIDPKTGGKSEMIGEIMGQISFYLNQDATFSNQELEILNNVIPLDNWYINYSSKTFNYTKYSASNYKEKVEKNFNDLIKIWIKKSIKYPSLYIKSLENLTESIWRIELEFKEADYNYINYEKDVAKKGNMQPLSDSSLNNLIKYNKTITYSPLRWLFQTNGEGLFIIIFACLVITKKHLLNFKYYIPFILTLSNTLVIMFLITGLEYRFSYYQTIVSIPLLIYSLYSKEKNVEK